MNVPLGPGAPPPISGPHQEVPASHVGRPLLPHPAHLHVTSPGCDGTVTITGILTRSHESADVLPERVKPKGEPTEDAADQPTRTGRRKGPRRRGR